MSDQVVILGVWTVLIVPFVFIASYLWRRADLTPTFILFYWIAPIIAMLLGVIPPPWAMLTG